MTVERIVDIDGTKYPVVLSDDPKTLLAAKAAGRVVVGLAGEISAVDEASDKTANNAEKSVSDADNSTCGADKTLYDADYNVDRYDNSCPRPWLPVNFVAAGLPVDEAWLEGAVRRELGIPWKIAETERLIIREFSADDCGSIPDDAGDSPDEAILKDPERLQTYIEEQYAFFDCGMWALVRKEDEQIVGMVSLTPWAGTEAVAGSEADTGPEASARPDVDADSGQRICELGYHVYTPYRRCGYAEEACEKILELLAVRKICTMAHADAGNSASVSLLKKLGFEQVSSDCFLRPDFV